MNFIRLSLCREMLMLLCKGSCWANSNQVWTASYKVCLVKTGVSICIFCCLDLNSSLQNSLVQYLADREQGRKAESSIKLSLVFTIDPSKVLWNCTKEQTGRRNKRQSKPQGKINKGQCCGELDRSPEWKKEISLTRQLGANNKWMIRTGDGRRKKVLG